MYSYPVYYSLPQEDVRFGLGFGVPFYGGFGYGFPGYGFGFPGYGFGYPGYGFYRRRRFFF